MCGKFPACTITVLSFTKGSETANGKTDATGGKEEVKNHIDDSLQEAKNNKLDGNLVVPGKATGKSAI